MFGHICACLDVLGNIGKSNSLSVLDLIICTLGNSLLIIFVGGCIFLTWEGTTMNFPVHPELSAEGFSYFVSCVFFVVCARARLLHKY